MKSRRTPTVGAVTPAEQFEEPQSGEDNSAVLERMRGGGSPGTPGDEDDGGEPLPDDLLLAMEESFQTDFDDVRIHTGTDAAETADSLGAEAFTRGNDIFWGGSAPDIRSPAGEELLSHELTHVTQARQGRTRGAHASSDVSSPGDELEREASQTARRVSAGESVQGAAPSSTPTGGLILREVTQVAANMKTSAEMNAMTLSQFKNYADRQADWYAEASLTEDDKNKLRTALAFAREDGAVAGCGDVLVSAFVATGMGPAVLVPLRAFNAACREGAATVRIRQPAPLLANKILWGEALIRLQNGMSGELLSVIMPQLEFELLITHNLIDQFVSYYQTFQPVLEANSGREVRSFKQLVVDDGASINSYQGIPHMRSIHRFEKSALDAALANWRDTSKSKPLALVLHSSMDHNGAFHRDSNLTAVLTDPRNLALLYEGASTLAEVMGDIPTLAANYGQNGKIAQCMFAGHGNARSIELAGTPAGTYSTNPDTGERKVDVNLDDVDLDNNAAASQALMQTLLANMGGTSSDPARIVFNACLTNSNSTEGLNLAGLSDADAATAINSHVQANGSLATTVQKMANQAGAHVQSLGANASIGEVGLIEPATGRLTIDSAEDPSVTNSKIDYVENGVEPQGAMRAVVESWANPAVGPQQTFDAMARRLGLANATATANYGSAAGQAFRECLIRTLYARILTSYRSSIADINRLSTSVVPAVGHLDVNDPTYCNPTKVDSGMVSADVAPLFTALSTSGQFGRDSIRLPIWQVWLSYDGSKATLLTSNIGARTRSGLCASVGQWVGDDFLRPYFSTLLPSATAGADPGTSGLFLALLHVGRRGAGSDQAAKSFLHTLAAAGREFPAALQVDQMLAGFEEVDTILEAIGLGQPGTTGAPDAGSSDVEANVDMNQDGTNETYIAPASGTKLVTRCSQLNVRAKPNMSGRIIGVLSAGDTVELAGTSRRWTAIEFGGSTGFVYTDYLQ